MNLRRFAIRMDQMGKTLHGNAEKLVRKVALSVDATVVSATPVNTGRARSNWIAEIGSPSKEVRDAYVPGEAGSSAGANTQIALALARATIATYNSGDTLHLTNNLPYIAELNRGSSAQAPAGFVETAVLDGIAQVNGAKLLDPNGISE